MLTDLPWVKDLLHHPDIVVVKQAGAMAAGDEAIFTKENNGGMLYGIDPDHLFLSMLRQHLLADILFLYNEPKAEFHTAAALGPDVAGHPRITHGGFSAALIDETAGGLIFKLKQAGKLGPGPAYTARLEVDYKLPLPTQTVVVCTARVVSVEGRKAWIGVEMKDSTAVDSVVYAAGKALFVTPRQHWQKHEEGRDKEAKQ